MSKKKIVPKVEKTCMYCCDMRGMIEYIVDNSNMTARISEGEIEIVNAETGFYSYIPIKYCTECGRKL